MRVDFGINIVLRGRFLRLHGLRPRRHTGRRCRRRLESRHIAIAILLPWRILLGQRLRGYRDGIRYRRDFRRCLCRHRLRRYPCLYAADILRHCDCGLRNRRLLNRRIAVRRALRVLRRGNRRCGERRYGLRCRCERRYSLRRGHDRRHCLLRLQRKLRNHRHGLRKRRCHRRCLPHGILTRRACRLVVNFSGNALLILVQRLALALRL